MRFQIVLTFTADQAVPESTFDEIAGAAFAQLEALTDDHGIPYRDAKVETFMALASTHAPGKT